MEGRGIVLEVKNLKLGFQNKKAQTMALDGIDFQLKKGEILGIVGESGSGKSVTSLSIMKLLESPPAIYKSGEINFFPKGLNLLAQDEETLRKIRGNEIAMIFQEPMTSLNPSQKAGKQILEAILIHRKIAKEEAKKEIIAIFGKVLLPDPERIYNSYPHQLSGGQLQRVMIAMAMINKPSILIADEPTTALDVTVQKQILKTIKVLQKDFDTTTIFISHDLGVIKEIADRVLVMQYGKIVEAGEIEEVFNKPKHPYTKGLIACRPPLNRRVKKLPTVKEMLELPEEQHQIFLQGVEETNEEYNNRLNHIEAEPNILIIKNLNKKFPKKKNWYGKVTEYNHALQNISLVVKQGETLGLVGESGCGKTTLGNCLLRLLPADSGQVLYKGTDLLSLSDKDMKTMRKKIQMIFQDPYSSLNPRLTIGEAIIEPMTVHMIGKNKEQRRELAAQLLEEVDLSPDYMSRYPHQFSGGQRQRICIARTLSVRPEFIVCDESVSALDVSVQAQVLNLLNDLKSKYNLTMIFISHDLSVIKHISDHVAVMNNGIIVEFNRSESLFHDPKNEYSRNLLEAIPAL
jgi:peptide/nickel transport system ATP-binding protein